MKTNKFGQIRKEFFSLTGIYLGRRCVNKLSDNSLRKDNLFPLLAEKIFDHKEILKVLKKRIGFWLSQDNSETILALAGYIYYLDCNFNKAKKYFLKTIEKNPNNLDNWFDLAFCLYHCSLRDNKLAKAILFNFDLFIQFFKKLNYNKCTLKGLQEIQKKILAKGLEYSSTYIKYIDSRDLKRILKGNSVPLRRKLN